MARIDWHAGKFSADLETKRDFEGMEGWASRYGDWINYYKLDQDATSTMTCTMRLPGRARSTRT